MNQEILKDLIRDENGIYSYSFENKDQAQEKEHRSCGVRRTDNFLEVACRHHSVPVMDREIRLFLNKLPQNANILDIGGCWGWHWRELPALRPDVTVYLVDFVYENLLQAKILLADQIDANIILVHGDATQLIFADNLFDGAWTVQAFQHIPNFSAPVKEAHRVLKPGGYFINYSWNNGFWVRVIYAIFNKIYYIKGDVPGLFWLARASDEQKQLIAEIFNNNVVDRYSEILFTPDFKFPQPGREGSMLGMIDSYLSNNFGLFSSIARQRSFQVQKVK